MRSGPEAGEQPNLIHAINAHVRGLAAGRQAPKTWLVEQTAGKAEVRSHVFNVPLESERGILKVYLDRCWHPHKEVATLMLVRAIPGMPVVLAHQLDSLPMWTLRPRIAGTIARPHLRVLPDVVRFAYQMHQIAMPSYGEIVGEFLPIRNATTLREYLHSSRQYWADGIAGWQRLPHRARYGQLIGMLRLPTSSLSETPVLAHTDLAPANTIVDGDMVHVIDFDNTLAAYPELDLCKLYLSFRISGWDITLPRLAALASSVYQRPHRAIETALTESLWVPFVRLLNYYRRRDDLGGFLRLWRRASSIAGVGIV